MSPFAFAKRRPVTTVTLVLALAGGGVLGMAKMGVDLPPPLSSPRISAGLDSFGARAKRTIGNLVGQFRSSFHKHEEETHQESRKVVVTSPKAMDVTVVERYVCQIHS